MITNDMLIDGFERVHDVVHATLKGLSDADLAFRPTKDANSIAWLIWHLTRVQDDHISELRGIKQQWVANGWYEKFKLPFDKSATGWSQNSKEVAQVKVGSKLLADYYDDVHSCTVTYLKTLRTQDYKQIVDRRWKPPVTLAVRVVSVLDDDLQHAGQAAYVRGLL